MTGMTNITHRQVDANGISVHIAEIGSGPLVLFCHGFPESWYSWRHQLPAVAEAGFHAVAMDMRGYGGTTQPTDIGAYTVSHLVADVVDVVRALGETTAVVVGHDWGAPIAWWSALLRPDMFRAVAGMSVPFLAPLDALPEGITMNAVMEMMAAGREYYRLYFQEPGRADAELDADVRHSLLGFMYTISGDVLADGVRSEPFDGHFPKGERLVDQFDIPARLPSWLTETDLQHYVDDLTRTGFFGGVSWYRNIDLVPTILSPFRGAVLRQPSFYIGGDTDMIAGNTPDAIEAMRAALPDLRHCELLPGAGHWIQQECPAEVTAALLQFLRSLG
jgi:pimeloyl-ACP methyl ester carboxylesterase